MEVNFKKSASCSEFSKTSWKLLGISLRNHT
uniref:Uncharacterized protein n=1 Tax=Arundo donax TaxID=35708 RepID=A0A0A9C7V3_ARUDO